MENWLLLAYLELATLLTQLRLGKKSHFANVNHCNEIQLRGEKTGVK